MSIQERQTVRRPCDIERTRRASLNLVNSARIVLLQPWRRILHWRRRPRAIFCEVEIQHIVEQGILQLSTKYRVVVMLRDVQQLSGPEVARQLGLTVSAVKIRLLRGRLMLRDLLAPYFSKNAT